MSLQNVEDNNKSQLSDVSSLYIITGLLYTSVITMRYNWSPIVWHKQDYTYCLNFAWQPTKCLHGLAPPYLTTFCTPLSAVAGRTHLRSADQHKLFVPRTSTSTFNSRAFSSLNPLSWNALPPQLRDPAISISVFRQSLKTHLFNNNSDWQCVIVVLYICRFSSAPSPHALSWQFLFS